MVSKIVSHELLFEYLSLSGVGDGVGESKIIRATDLRELGILDGGHLQRLEGPHRHYTRICTREQSPLYN